MSVGKIQFNTAGGGGAGGGGGGVSSINGESGVLILSGASGVNIQTNGTTLSVDGGNLFPLDGSRDATSGNFTGPIATSGNKITRDVGANLLNHIPKITVSSGFHGENTQSAHVTFGLLGQLSEAETYQENGQKLLTVSSGSVQLLNGTANSRNGLLTNVVFYDNDGILRAAEASAALAGTVDWSVLTSGITPLAYVLMGESGRCLEWSPIGFPSHKPISSWALIQTQRGLFWDKGAQVTLPGGVGTNEISMSAGSGLLGAITISVTAKPSGTQMIDQWGRFYTFADDQNYSDGAGGNTALSSPNNDWKIDLIWVDGGGDIHYERALGSYKSEAEAIDDANGFDAIMPENKGVRGMPIAELVIQLNNGIQRIIDVRGKTLGASASSPGISDHSSLNGLANDDHTQYLLTDGTRAGTAGLEVATSGTFPSGIIISAPNGSGWRLTLDNDGILSTEGPFNL